MSLLSTDSIGVAYERETTALIRQRLALFALTFIVFMGMGSVVEARNFPERNPYGTIAYALEALTCLVAVVLSRSPRTRDWPRVTAAIMAVTVMALITGYHAYVNAPAQRIVMALVTVLGTLSVTVPWGFRPQAVSGVGGVVAVALGVWSGRLTIDQEAAAMPVVAMLAMASIGAYAAASLERYRFEAFRRTMMQAAEAEIAAGLLAVTQTMSRNLDDPAVLERVTTQSLAAVGCDFSSIYLFDLQRARYQLAASTLLRPEDRQPGPPYEYDADELPLFRTFRPGEISVIEDTDAQALVPLDTMRALGISSAMYAPIGRQHQIVGVLVNGYRDRRGPFTDKEQRLTLGIAHATAVAMENSRLITELQAANRLKSDFVATMSHELRTPLNIIAGYAEMLADRVFEPYSPGWDDAITRVQRSTMELTDLVAATLDLNRLDAGRDPVDRQPLDVAHLVERLAHEVEPLVAPGVRLRWEVQLDGLQVLSDLQKLRTILKNLLVNALKFTSHGEVVVRLGAQGETLVAAVHDSGIGIAAEHLPMIFDMFRQVDGSSTRRFGGVGLGLHIVQRLTSLLGGGVTVESQPEIGSTFTVRLPQSLAAAPQTYAI